MRALFLLPLLPIIALAAPAPQPVIALLPAEGSTPELTRLGLLIEARAAELLESTGRYRELHLKQVLAMAGQEGLDVAKLSDDEPADRARALLGADRVIAVRLTAKSDGLLVEGSVRSRAAPVPFGVVVPTGWSKQVRLGSEVIARAVLAQDQATLPDGAKAQPEATSDLALKSLATCWEVALYQSMSVEAPVTVSSKELQAAISACRAAIKADPTLSFASAVLALLLAIDRQDAAAEKILDGLPADSDPLEPRTLARFWLLTRNQSYEAGATFLSEAIRRHPGELLLRAYLAETLASSNQHAKAAAAWNEYLSLAPGSAYAHGRLSRSLAKLEQWDSALKAAKDGLALAPGSREARLQFAGRQIDAKKPADALVTLVPLAELPDPPAEGLLRLGWAYWLLDDVESAEQLFKVASERATGPMAWRTKGRALYSLSLVELKAGHADAAKVLYQRSVATGFVVKPDRSLRAPPTGPAARPSPAGGSYVCVDKVEAKDVTLTQAELGLAQKLARDTVAKRGASLAPEGEEKRSALAVITAQHLKGFELSLRLVPGGKGEGSLKAEAMVMTYPERAFRGVWSVGAAGAGSEELIKAIVPKVLEDVAGDLEW